MTQRVLGCTVLFGGFTAAAACARGTGTGNSVDACSHRRKPPANASALLPKRQLGGSVSFCNFLALPPPITTYSGCSAALSRSMTSRQYSRHFFVPCFFN